MSWESIGELTEVEGMIDADQYMTILGDHLLPSYHGHFKPDVILVIASATAQGKQIKAVPLTMVHAPP